MATSVLNAPHFKNEAAAFVYVEAHLWPNGPVCAFCGSKKGISTRQVQRMLDCSMKTAWFLTHRIREAMKDNGGQIGGFGKTVEADETYLTKSPKTRKPIGTALTAKPAPMVFD